MANSSCAGAPERVPLVCHYFEAGSINVKSVAGSNRFCIVIDRPSPSLPVSGIFVAVLNCGFHKMLLFI
jgi:hypothetical protein